MSLLRRSQAGPAQLQDRAPWGRSSGRVTASDALRQSTTWAAIRLRADLVSQLPVDVFRKSEALGRAVEVPRPKVLESPAWVSDAAKMSIDEWLYSSQTSLDQYGNAVGIIRKVDAFNLPAEIELVDMAEVAFRVKGNRISEYRVNGERVDSRHVWHERQYTFAGLPVGLSPISYAALTLEAGLNAKHFAVDWFQNGTMPSAVLRNAERVLDPADADRTKTRFKRSVESGDIFVTGRDWEFHPIQAKGIEQQFLEQSRATDQDICRYLGVTGDLVDVSVDTATINYANISQRNVQLLVINLGPAIKRRETALTRLVPGNRFVKMNRSAILAMDEATRAEVMRKRIQARMLTPDEARALEDLGPLTEADIELFDRLFGRRDRGKSYMEGPDDE